MGNLPSYFNKERLELYSVCSYFTEIEVRQLYNKFSNINRDKIDPVIGDALSRISFDEVLRLKELRVCPFGRRLCEVFTTDPDEKGLSFEDFLDMMSVFSDRAPWNIKATYAFKIFDFDSDNKISISDIKCAIHCLTGHDLQISELEAIVLHILTETDVLYSTNYLNYTEFEHMLVGAPYFLRLFRIPIL